MVSMADDWVFDFVLAVFETPAWTNPIDDFIDAHCGLFEGAETGSVSARLWRFARTLRDASALTRYFIY